MITNIVGARIRTIRLSQNISQEKLALKAELDRTYLASGKRNISIVNLEKIINALEISFEEFFKNM